MRNPYDVTCDLQVAKLHSPITYPKPDGAISFDVPTSLHRYLSCKISSYSHAS